MKQPNKKVILILLAALNFTHILDFMIMMPLGNYLMPYFSISPQQFSYLVAAYTLSASLSGFLAAFFVDRYDRKNVLLIGYGGFLIGTLFCGLAPSYATLLIARIVAGLFGGLIGAQVLSIVSDLFSYEERGKAMGSVISAFAIASTFGVPFALYLANLISWHAPFLFVAIAGLG
ncbi:MAG TPA: MFS transporter, partial [Chitinophagaceae bacterium]|nr:MFS transporter [Chitinophagaceae bacterium]